VYDNFPKFCTCCKHQGHDERSCHWRIEKNKETAAPVKDVEGLGNLDKLKGDARDFLNAKRVVQIAGETTNVNVVEQQVVQGDEGKQTDKGHMDETNGMITE